MVTTVVTAKKLIDGKKDSPFEISIFLPSAVSFIL